MGLAERPSSIDHRSEHQIGELGGVVDELGFCDDAGHWWQ